MTEVDAVAAAVLAAAQCAASGQTSSEAYFNRFIEYEGLFEQHRAAQKVARTDGANDVWAGLEK
jgi:hypothetical protein